MRRLLPLTLFLLLAACTGGTSEPDAHSTLARATDFLWSQQAEDGGWHSATHGIVRGGQAWTPFVLDALLRVPEEIAPRPEGGMARALQFVRDHVDATGALGLAVPPVLEYPNYSTAYGLRVLATHGTPEDSALVRRMADYLRGQQFTEARGITPEHPAYGAWGFGETNLASGEVGHLDLSHTRRALEALRAADALDPAAVAAATRFLRLVQKHPDDERPQPPNSTPADSALYDGGFYASPTVPGVNKAGVVDGVYGAYATTTADGILALLAAGHTPESEPVQAALDWLREHPGWDEPSGLSPDNAGQWQRVMQLYGVATRAEAYDRLGETGWHDESLAPLLALQRDDGAFTNPEGAPNKEDDPLLATALAVDALTRISRNEDS